MVGNLMDIRPSGRESHVEGFRFSDDTSLKITIEDKPGNCSDAEVETALSGRGRWMNDPPGSGLACPLLHDLAGLWRVSGLISFRAWWGESSFCLCPRAFQESR